MKICMYETASKMLFTQCFLIYLKAYTYIKDGQFFLLLDVCLRTLAGYQKDKKFLYVAHVNI